MCKRGTGATSGYDLTVVKVAFDFLDDSCPVGRGLTVEPDPTDDRGVGGLDVRFGLLEEASTLVS